MSEQMKDGYYWVRYKKRWVIAEYMPRWYNQGIDARCFVVGDTPCYFLKVDIGDYIETPEKYKK